MNKDHRGFGYGVGVDDEPRFEHLVRAIRAAQYNNDASRVLQLTEQLDYEFGSCKFNVDQDQYLE